MNKVRTGRQAFEPVPFETYMSMALDQLRGKRVVVNLALREFEKDPGHHNYDVAVPYYRNERGKIQRAINRKKMEAGWEPPEIRIGMQALDMRARAHGMGKAEVPDELVQAFEKALEVIQQNGNDPLAALMELLRAANSQGKEERENG